MNIIYLGKDITELVEVKQADIHDNAGGKADSIDLIFADPVGLWSQWKPKKNDEIIVKEEGFSSGKMYVDFLGQKPGLFYIKGISSPPNSKSKNFKTWENIRFLKVASDLAKSAGLTLVTYGLTDWLYARVGQVGETHLELLNKLCIREGYTLKVTDTKAVIYDERKLEKVKPVTIQAYDILGDYKFKDSNEGLKSACEVKHVNSSGDLIQYIFNPPTALHGGVLKINERVTNQGEAERFAKGYLRNENKREITNNITINLNPKIAAGNMVELVDVGMANGLYFIDKIVPRLVHSESVLYLRRPLEGY